MIVTNEQTLLEIKQSFNEAFPFLKMEFYNNHYKVDEGVWNFIPMNDQQKLGIARTVHEPYQIKIVPRQKVFVMVNNFCELYGLEVKVFRKSGRVWLETNATNHWTLQTQNDTGKETQLQVA